MKAVMKVDLTVATMEKWWVQSKAEMMVDLMVGLKAQLMVEMMVALRVYLKVVKKGL